MKTVAAKLYEGMFLVDSALAASDWQGINDTIRAILEKAGAEIVSANKWDERRLAYGIKGKSRGTYILVYFRVDGTRITEIERSVQLSEDVMRALILCVEDLDEQYITKETPAMSVRSNVPEETEPSFGTVEESLDQIDEDEPIDQEAEQIEQADFSDESGIERQ